MLPWDAPCGGRVQDSRGVNNSAVPPRPAGLVAATITGGGLTSCHCGACRPFHVLVPRRLFLLRPVQLWREELRCADYYRTARRGPSAAVRLSLGEAATAHAVRLCGSPRPRSTGTACESCARISRSVRCAACWSQPKGAVKGALPPP